MYRIFLLCTASYGSLLELLVIAASVFCMIWVARMLILESFFRLDAPTSLLYTLGERSRAALACTLANHVAWSQLLRRANRRKTRLGDIAQTRCLHACLSDVCMTCWPARLAVQAVLPCIGAWSAPASS